MDKKDDIIHSLRCLQARVNELNKDDKKEVINYLTSIFQSDISKSLKEHYEVIKSRGKINSSTTLKDFIEKIKEESSEVVKSYENNEGIDLLTQEGIDLLCVVNHMIVFLGKNLLEELNRNVLKQQLRINNE